MIMQHTPTASVLRGYAQQEDFSFDVVEDASITAPVTTSVTVLDASIFRQTGAGANNCRLAVVDSLLAAGHEFINNTPTIASVDASGNIAWLANGLASIDIKTPVGTRRYTRQMTNGAAVTTDTFQGFLAGSLGLHVVDAMQALVVGKTPDDTTKNLFSSNNYSASAPAAVRNPSVFTGALGLSAISIVNNDWDGKATYQHPALLISPRHIIGAQHYQPYGPVTFMRPDGSMQTVGITSKQLNIGGATDIYVGYLDAPVTGVTPFQVLPSNWRSYLGSAETAETVKLPALTKTAHRADGTGADQISVNNVYAILGGSVRAGNAAYAPGAPALTTDNWYTRIVGGDSGGPVFIPVNGALVLLCAYWSAGSGYHYGDKITEINSAMNTLASAAGDATSYALQHPILTGFTTFV